MAIVRNPRPRSHSTGLVIEKTYPTAAAGTRTMARNEAHTIADERTSRIISGSFEEFRDDEERNDDRHDRRGDDDRFAPEVHGGPGFSITPAAHKRFLTVAHHIFNAVWPIHRMERRRIADRGHRRGGDGPRSRGAGGPAWPRRPSAGHQDGIYRARDGTDSVVSRQARREKADYAGPGGRSPGPNSCDPRAERSLPRRGLRDRGGLRGPGAQTESLPRTRSGRAAEDDPRVEHVRVADHGHGLCDEATEEGRWDAFLQPAHADAARRGHPSRHDERRDI